MNLVEDYLKRHERSLAVPLIILALLSVLVILISRRLSNNEPQPPYLKEAIPFVSNTYQYFTDMGAFLDRAM